MPIASDPVDNIAQLIAEVKAYDDDVATAFKDDSSGILAFVSHNVIILPSLAMIVFKSGLFSAIVTLFIIESYKLLSLDSGPPGSAILWVNALWFISLVLALVSALNVMLVQDWIRQYLRFTKGLSSDQDQGHARLILFTGAQKYGISNATLLSSLPLHIAVALFLAGLIIFLFRISHVIATVVAISVGLFGLWYFVLTILPTIDASSPWFTPASWVWWYIWHAFIWIVARYVYLYLNLINLFIPQYDKGEVVRAALLYRALESIKGTLSTYGKNLREGFRGSLVRRVLNIRDAGVDKGHRAFDLLIPRPVMDDQSKLEKLLSHTPPATLFRLFVSTDYTSSITLHSRFYHLLNSCTVTPGTIRLVDEEQKCRLQTCLDVLNNIAKFALYDPPPQQWQQSSSDLLDAVWMDFANTDIMEPLWALWESGDTAIRVTARSVCALFAVHIVRAGRDDEQVQVWLQHVMGQDLASEIIEALLDRPTFDFMNIKSFILGARFDLSGDGNLRSKEEILFVETLAILIYTSNSQDDFSSQITSLIEQMESYDVQNDTNVAVQLRTVFHILQPRPPSPVGDL